MNTIINRDSSQLRQKIDVIEFLILLNINLNDATSKQLKNIKLFIQILQSAGINFSDIKLLLFNITEWLPVYMNLDLDTLMKIRFPVTKFDLYKNQ